MLIGFFYSVVVSFVVRIVLRTSKHCFKLIIYNHLIKKRTTIGLGKLVRTTTKTHPMKFVCSSLRELYNLPSFSGNKLQEPEFSRAINTRNTDFFLFSSFSIYFFYDHFSFACSYFWCNLSQPHNYDAKTEPIVLHKRNKPVKLITFSANCCSHSILWVVSKSRRLHSYKMVVLLLQTVNTWNIRSFGCHCSQPFYDWIFIESVDLKQRTFGKQCQ